MWEWDFDDLCEVDFHTSPLHVYTLTLTHTHTELNYLTAPHSAQTRSEFIIAKQIWKGEAQS